MLLLLWVLLLLLLWGRTREYCSFLLKKKYWKVCPSIHTYFMKILYLQNEEYVVEDGIQQESHLHNPQPHIQPPRQPQPQYSNKYSINHYPLLHSHTTSTTSTTSATSGEASTSYGKENYANKNIQQSNNRNINKSGKDWIDKTLMPPPPPPPPPPPASTKKHHKGTSTSSSSSSSSSSLQVLEAASILMEIMTATPPWYPLNHKNIMHHSPKAKFVLVLLLSWLFVNAKYICSTWMF